MAAVLPVAGDAASKVAGAVRAELSEAAEDPLLWLAHKLKTWGTVALVGGVGAYLVGRALVGVGNSAKADEGNTLASIANVFGNVGQGYNSGASLWGLLPVATTVPFSVSGAVGPTVYDTIQPLKTYSGTGAVSATLTITDAQGNVVTDNAGIVWNGIAVTYSVASGQSSTGASKISLPDGTRYIVDLVVTVGSTKIEAMYGTQYIYSQGILTLIDTSTGEAWLTTDTKGNPVGNVTFTGSTKGSTPTQSQTQSSTTAMQIPVLSQVFGSLGAFATAIGDLPKAIFVTFTSIPHLAMDVVGIGLGGVGWLLQKVGAWFAVAGAVMMVTGGATLAFYPRLKARLVLGLNARTARLWNRFDKWYRTRRKIQEVWTQKSTEAAVHSANANPVFVPPVEKLPAPEPEKIPGVPAAVPDVPPPPGPENSPAPPPPGPENSPVPPPPPEDKPPAPPPPDAPTAVPEVGPTSDKSESAPDVSPGSGDTEPGGGGPEVGSQAPAGADNLLSEQQVATKRADGKREWTESEIQEYLGKAPTRAPEVSFNPEVRSNRDRPERRRLDPTPAELLLLANSIDGGDPNRSAQYVEASQIQERKLHDREKDRAHRAAERQKASRSIRSRSMGYETAMNPGA